MITRAHALLYVMNWPATNTTARNGVLLVMLLVQPFHVVRFCRVWYGMVLPNLGDWLPTSQGALPGMPGSVEGSTSSASVE